MTYNQRKPLATWLTQDEQAKFYALAKAHGVTAAALLRALVVDAFNDEHYTLSSFVDPSGDIQYCAHLKTLHSLNSDILSH